MLIPVCSIDEVRKTKRLGLALQIWSLHFLDITLYFLLVAGFKTQTAVKIFFWVVDGQYYDNNAIWL